jgi:hypothetical protein
MKNQIINHRAIKQGSRFILIGGGGSGGDGKTTASVALADYFRSRGIPVVLVDAETEPKPKGRLKCYYPEAEELDIHGKSILYSAGTQAVNEGKLTLVDLGAGAGPQVLKWLTTMQKAFNRQGVPITLICLVTSAPHTLSCVIRWAKALGDSVSYLVVKNDREQAGFGHLDSEAGIAFIKDYKPTFIELSYRNPDIYSMLEGKDISPCKAIELFEQAATDPNASEKLGSLDDLLLMSEIEADRDQIFAQFDSVIDLLLPKQIHEPEQ